MTIYLECVARLSLVTSALNFFYSKHGLPVILVMEMNKTLTISFIPFAFDFYFGLPRFFRITLSFINGTLYDGAMQQCIYGEGH